MYFLKNCLLVFCICILFNPFVSSLDAEALTASIKAEKAGNFSLAIEELTDVRSSVEPAIFLKRMGWLHYLKKDYEKSLEYYSQAFQQFPDDVQAYLGGVMVLRAAGEIEDAKRVALSALDRFPDNYQLNSHLAHIYFSQKQYVNAIKYGLKYPRDYVLVTLSGWAYLHLEKLELAKFKFITALKLAPRYTSAQSGYAAVEARLMQQLHRKLKEEPENLTLLKKLAAYYFGKALYLAVLPLQEKIVKLEGDSIFETKRLAWLYYQLGKFKKSLLGYKAAMELGDGKDSLVGALKALYALKDYASLKQVAEMLLEKDPQNYYARYHIGAMLFDLKEYDRAEPYFKKFYLDAHSQAKLGLIRELKNKPEEAKAYYLYALKLFPGQVEAIQGLRRLALSSVQKYLTEFDNDPEELKPLFIAISIYIANGKSDEIIAVCLKGLKHHPDNQYLLGTLAYNKYLKGEFEEALTIYENQFAKNDKNYIALRGQVNCLLALKKYEDAKQPLEILYAAYPGSYEIRRLYSFVLFQTGYYRAQIKLATAFPEDIVMQRTCAWTYFRQGKYSKSREKFEKILEKYPEDKGSIDGLEIAKQPGQVNLGFFYTPLDYGSYKEDKRVGTTLVTYAPHKWLSFRALYNRTESETRSIFAEDAYDLGLTYFFADRFNVGVDYLWMNNNDSKTDGGSITAFQLGYKFNDRVTGTLEYDFSDYPGVDVGQFSPRIDWFPDGKWWLQTKGYFFDKSGSAAPSGDESAIKQSVTYFIDSNWTVGGDIWTGEKRFAFETDKLYPYNSYDLYNWGYGLKVTYRAKKSWEATLGYAMNDIDAFSDGKNYEATQWTLGVKLRY
ncbi:tetratricopeptide repeat protein [Candidatus Riflebacteria bacterium]